MEEKPDQRLRENFPKKEPIIRQSIGQIRRVFTQNLGEEIREKERVSATCSTIVSAFQLYLTHFTGADIRKILFQQFFDELLDRMPELGLGSEIKHDSWQCVLEPLIGGIIHSD